MASVEIVDEFGKRVAWLKPKKREAFKTISKKRGGVFEIALRTEGPEGGVVVWEKILIRTPVPPEASVSSTSRTSELTAARPDIFLYVVDTLRADHLGCYGYDRGTSPRLDAFARESTLYEYAYAQTSWTRPSAASILTGLYPKTHGTIGRDDRLNDEVVTIAERLRDGGYETIGVVANGHLHETFGFDKGFQTYIYTGLVSSARVHREVEALLRPRLDRKDRSPLFVLIWTIDPHDPYEPEPEDADLFGIGDLEPLETDEGNLLIKIRMGEIRPTPSQKEFLKARYDQEIFGNDRAFGHLLDLLESHGRKDETVVIFTADHGEEFFDHGDVGHGRTLYNEQIRIPLIVKDPNLAPGRIVSKAQHVDLYPYILEIAGLYREEGLDGISLTEIGDGPRTIFSEVNLDGYDVTAVLKDHKAVYTRIRNADPNFVPIFELFESDDIRELRPRTPQSFRDRLYLQKVFHYRNIPDSPYHRVEVDEQSLPPEIREHLRALGYIR